MGNSPGEPGETLVGFGSWAANTPWFGASEQSWGRVQERVRRNHASTSRLGDTCTMDGARICLAPSLVHQWATLAIAVAQESMLAVGTNRDYVHISLARELAKRVDHFLDESTWGFKSRAEVVHVAVREFLQRHADTSDAKEKPGKS